MQLIATLRNLERKEEILSLVDGVVVYSSDFSSFKILGLNKNEIIDLIKSTDKRVIIDLSFMLENEEIEAITDYALAFKPYNCDFICSDLGVLEILDENGMSSRAIYDPNTLITNSYDLGFYLRFASSAKISEEITLKDQLNMINKYPNKATKLLFCYHLMFHSKRHLISMYLKFLGKSYNIDNESSYLIEQTRNDKYHIIESNRGIALFRPYLLDSSAELLSLNNLKYGIVNSLFLDDELLIKVLSIYRMVLDKMISELEAKVLISNLGLEINDGFKYEDTIYQKELIKCQ
ncbi:MAG: hypothetical protein HP024_02830 [Acholeplasmatales bacterium]|nr:hypothetical protein [Acholeplasmatales bacterium]